jgi:MFS family permease
MDQASSLQQVDGLHRLSDIRRRFAFSVVLAASVGASLVFSVLPPILPALARHFGGGKAGELSAQFAMTMPSLGWLIGGAISGWVLARAGVRWMIIVSMGALGLLGAIGGMASDITTFLATRLGLGFAGAFMFTACITLLTHLYEDDARPKMIGYTKAMSSGAAIPIGLAAGAMAKMLDWRAPFALYAVFGVLAVLLALAAVPADRRASSVAAAKTSAEKGQIWRLWPILVMIFFLHIITMMGVTQMPFVLAEHGLTSPTTLSIVLSVAALLMSVGAIASGHLQVRFGVAPVLALAVSTAAAGCIVVGLASTGAVAAAGNALAVLGCGLYFPQYLTLPLSRVGPSGRGMAIGLVQAAMYLGAFLNPIILAPLRGLFGLSGTYVTVGIIAASAVAVGVGRTLLRNGPRGRAARA